MSYEESLSSMRSLSVKAHTKRKLDALLKKVTQKRSNSAVSQEDLLQNEDLDTPHSENYILNKFLRHEEQKTEAVELQELAVKAPVPKPRKSKCQEAFKVSPRHSKSSSDSRETFKVSSPRIFKNSVDVHSPLSNKTYNVEEVGDVLVHSSPALVKVVKPVKSVVEKQDTEILSDNESEDEVLEVETKEIINNDEKQYSYEKIVELVVHKTDRLQLTSIVVHPVVKIHVVDMSNGKYLPKSDKSRSVVFFYEENDYISPVMTQAYNLQEKRILYPTWQESILLNEDFHYFTNAKNNILFFELLDFVSFASINQVNGTGHSSSNGWYNIAFAFLKLRGSDGSLNIGSNIRLQLYYVPKHKQIKDPLTCAPWIWWKKNQLKEYPSTLYISIKPTQPTTVQETFRSKTPIQREMSRIKLCDEIPITVPNTENNYEMENKLPETVTNPWKRKAHECCQLPNKNFTEFEGYDEGCFVMKFNHNGSHLACALQIDNLFYVVIYSILSLREVQKFVPHQAFIYDIKWSSDDALVLSASADNTVSVFHISSALCFQILPHPSFVYCCDIDGSNVIASGCFDGIIRLWIQEKSETKTEYALFQELEGHNGYVTSVCFNKKSNVFSADSTGIIIEWEKKKKDWLLKRNIHVLDLKETIINQLLLFPKERKLLVHSRDNLIRIVDIKSGCVLHWLRGTLNQRFQIFSTISPCGSFVFSGSENGSVQVYNARNGEEIASYIPFSTNSTIHCVQFHPQDNIIAISHYGTKCPIILYQFDDNIQEPVIKLTVKEDYLKNKLGNVSKIVPSINYIRNNAQNVKSEDRVDFKSVLHKMDVVLAAQKG